MRRIGINDLAVVGNSVDIYNPKVVRASMGALFNLNFQMFNQFFEYNQAFGTESICYPFMLKGENALGEFVHNQDTNFSLIFGNESGGLDDEFLNVGKSVVIDHSSKIHSLNLSLAVGIAIYEFTKMTKK